MKQDIHSAETVRPPAGYPQNLPTMRPEAPFVVFGEVQLEEPEQDLAAQAAAQLKAIEQRNK